MPSAQQLKRRIKSVDNTAKITKAMSMIAASKMSRAQQMALQSRPYSERMVSLLSDLAAQPQFEDDPHPLLTVRNISKIGVIVITPDRGLTGGLNTGVNRFAAQHILNSGHQAEVVTVGKKARDFFARTSNLKAVFTEIGDRPSPDVVIPIAKVMVDEYIAGNIDAVYVVYSKYINTTVQKPELITILPVQPAVLDQKDRVGYIYEPDSREVLNELVPRYIEMEIYHSILESVASEQSARMVAMRNATDNAIEMKSDLTLEMNKVRQESITSELLDIVGGVAAVEA
ncbi:MAG: F-type H+-transporting ATPase subunit gamma [Chloroflexi bacterium]|nr:MAG: F-type H+-transporting ATPase subunit gamma [Chloroflexota bacterium]